MSGKTDSAGRAGNSQNRNDRRDAARREAERLRAAQVRKERRNRMIVLGVSALVLALVAVAGVLIYQQSQRTLLSGYDGPVPASSREDGGIVVTTPEGAPEAGTSEVAVYLDFQCPYCAVFEDANAADLEALSDAGEATIVYHPVANLDSMSGGTMFSTRSANAAATVANDAPEQFLPFVNAMLANQPQEGQSGLPDEQIAQIAVDAGVPQEVADTFVDGTYTEWVDLATQQARRDGAAGTPYVFVDGERVDPEQVNLYEPGVLAGWLAEQGIGEA